MKKEILPKWDLTDFYPSHDSKELSDDFKELGSRVSSFVKMYRGKINIRPPGKIESVISKYEDIEEIILKIKSFIYLFYCTDQLNQNKSSFYQKTQERLTVIESELLFFTLELNKLNEKYVSKLKSCKYEYWIKVQRMSKKYQKNESIEKLLLDKSITSSNSWMRLFDETMARLKFNVSGKKLNESEVLNLMQSSKTKERKNAAQAFGETLKENSHLFSLITNTLSKDLNIDNKLRGFKDCDSFRHLNNQVEPEDVRCLVDTVKKNYNVISHKYYKYKAKIFKTDTLDYWDRNAPYPNQTHEEINWTTAKEIVLKAYGEFDKRIASIVNLFFLNSWIHAPVSNGKTSGAFAHPTVPSCHPYILLNYQYKIRDVMTLAHELGHGVHQYLANENGLLLADTPLTLAETASVFGEMLTFKSILRNATNKDQKRMILRSKIEDMLNTVIMKIAFYEFEKEIHKKRSEGELSIDEINNIWLKTQKDSLGSNVKLSGNYKYFWSYIPHFIHSPFYVYAYAFGDCLVNSLYAKFEEGDFEFNNNYLSLLKAGGSKNYKDLLTKFNLNPKEPDFWQSGLNIIKNLIDDLENLG